MKKVAILAVVGAVAAGAAAVCAKIIHDRKNAEEDYTACPCGCKEKEEAEQLEQPEAEQNEQPEEQLNAEETAQVQQEVEESFFQDEEEEPEVTIELVEEPAEQVEEPAESEDELEEHEEII